MHLYVHKNRHLVVANSEVPSEGSAQVRWVALAPGVDRKRGRHPNYDRPVPVAELSPASNVNDDLRRLAEDALNKLSAD